MITYFQDEPEYNSVCDTMPAIIPEPQATTIVRQVVRNYVAANGIVRKLAAHLAEIETRKYAHHLTPAERKEVIHRSIDLCMQKPGAKDMTHSLARLL